MTGDNLAWLAGPCPAGVWRRVIDAEQPGGTPFVLWGRVDEPEAVRLLAAWIFEALPVDRIGIAAERDNAGSCAVAERAGFRFEGVLRSWLVIKGVPRDTAMYSLLRGELAEQP